MDIQVSQNFIGEWIAIDANTYDADCDQDGFFSTSPIGYGKTPLDAIVDLLDNIEDRTSAEFAAMYGINCSVIRYR